MIPLDEGGRPCGNMVIVNPLMNYIITALKVCAGGIGKFMSLLEENLLVISILKSLRKMSFEGFVSPLEENLLEISILKN